MQAVRIKSISTLLSTVFAVSLMTGCATKVANLDYIELEAQKDAAMADESAAKSIQRAQMNIELGKSEKLDYFAPRHLKIAKDKQFPELRSNASVAINVSEWKLKFCKWVCRNLNILRLGDSFR